jgi:hypothetical protein
MSEPATRSPGEDIPCTRPTGPYWNEGTLGPGNEKCPPGTCIPVPEGAPG